MASTSTVSRTFPTLRYLAAPFRWFFRSRRRVLTSATVLLAMIAAPVVWWSIQLMGLPDIGEPFDVQAFQSSRIPDDLNAFVLYEQAAARLTPFVVSSRPKGEKVDLDARWSLAHPLVQRWVEENREAMELYRRGADRPDAMNLAGHDRDAGIEQVRRLLPLQELALLEASRLEEQGDMAGARAWYRAALRATYHLGRHGTVGARSTAQIWHGELRDRLAGWAHDPRTTPALLRRALDDAVACEALAPSDSYTLKARHLAMERMYDSKENPGRYVPLMRMAWFVDYTHYLPPAQVLEATADAWRWWRREPERSRRIMRLAVANWVTYYDLPPDRRPKPALNVSGPFDFFEPGPEAPAKSRVLSPEAIDLWRETSPEVTVLLKLRDLRALRFQERADHRALLVLLASELYRRDRGTDPTSERALVGPYLKELPDDGLDDGTRPAGSAAVEATRTRGSNGRGN